MEPLTGGSPEGIQACPVVATQVPGLCLIPLL